MSRQEVSLGEYEKSDIAVVWKLFEYVSPTGRGAIADWRGNLATVTRQVDFDTFLRSMVKKSKWEYPDLGALTGKKWKGLYELRWKSDGVPHRILGYFTGAGEFVMLMGCTHDKKKYDPSGALDTVVKRKANIKDKEATIHAFAVIAGNAVKK
jgi:predicted GNAT family acetyltransferase